MIVLNRTHKQVFSLIAGMATPSSSQLNDTLGSETLSAPAFSPLYQQIKQVILQSLQNGEWKPQESIPSEMELARRYGVSQGTVRKAIDELAAENIVVRRQGKGTFVASHNERHVEYRFLSLHPDKGTVDTEGRAQRQVLSCRRIRATAEQARLLQINPSDALMHVRRLLNFSGTPTILEDMWLPAHLFRQLTASMLEEAEGPTYALFEREFGVSTVRATEELRAVLPDAEQADLLQISTATPLLQVQRTSYTYNDTPVELRRGLYRTDTHHYRNTLS